MKKLLMFVFSLAILMSISITTEASTKVMWGNMELKPGQIGKVTILQEMSLFRVETLPSGEVTLYEPVRNLKPGEVYRVYGTKTMQGYAPLYNVGAGYYVLQNSKGNVGVVKYETPSKAKLALVNKR